MSAAPHINYTREFFRPSTPLKEQLQNTSHAYLAPLKYIFITSVIFFYKESLTFYPSSDYPAAVQKMKKGKGLMLTLLTCDTSCRAVPPPNMCFSTKFMVGSMVTIIHLCYGLCEPISCSSFWKVRTPSQSILQVNAWKYNLSFAPPSPPDWTAPLLLLIHQLIPLLDTCKTCTVITWYIFIYV